MFAKCDTCSIFKDEKLKTVDAERRKKALQGLLDKHLKLQSQEWQYYYRHWDLVQRNKRDCLSIIIYELEQSKTNLPHFTNERKSSSILWRPRTHLTGAITDGYGVYCYIDMIIWLHDANLTISILDDVLSKRDIPTIFIFAAWQHSTGEQEPVCVSILGIHVLSASRCFFLRFILAFS